MFIRPVGVTVAAAVRPAGRPLLRGLLTRAAGAQAAAAEYGRGGAAGEPVPASAWGETEAPGERDLGEAPVTAGEPWDAEVSGEPVLAEAPAAEAEAPGPGQGAGPGPGIGPGAGAGPGAGPGAGGSAVSGSLAAELTQLAGLAREGLLTPEEFTAAKSRLLRQP